MWHSLTGISVEYYNEKMSYVYHILIDSLQQKLNCFLCYGLMYYDAIAVINMYPITLQVKFYCVTIKSCWFQERTQIWQWTRFFGNFSLFTQKSLVLACLWSGVNTGRWTFHFILSITAVFWTLLLNPIWWCMIYLEVICGSNRWTDGLYRLCVVISESAENNCWEEKANSLSRWIRRSMFNEVVTLSCKELDILRRNRVRISYSCYAVYLKAVQKLFPSLGKRETTERGCNALKYVFDAWPVRKQNQVCPMKSCFMVHYVRRYMT